MSSDDDEPKGELQAIQELKEVKAAYGSAMSEAEYNQRLKKIKKMFSSGRQVKGERAARDHFNWTTVQGAATLSCPSLDRVRLHMTTDTGADKKSRGGDLPQFRDYTQCTYRKRMFDWGGAQWRYRIVQLAATKFCIQVGVPAGEEVDTNSDDEVDLGELFKPSLDVPKPPAAKKGGKRKPADAAAPETAEEEEEPKAQPAKRPRAAPEAAASKKSVSPKPTARQRSRR